MPLLVPSEVEKGLVRAMRQIIGHRLSVDSQTGLANVIREYPVYQTNEKGQKPQHPYVTCHILSNTAYQGWLLHEYVNDVGLPVYVVQFRLMAPVTVYGRNSLDIATELKQRLEISTNRDTIKLESGATLITTGILFNNYDFLSTDFEPSTPMMLTLDFIAEYVDESGSCIEFVEANGEILRYEGDPDPIPILIKEPPQEN